MTKEEFIPTAVIGLTNTMSLLLTIRHEDGDDYVYSKYRVTDSEVVSKVTRVLVKYNMHGNAYFTRSRQRYYLSEAMKLN